MRHDRFVLVLVTLGLAGLMLFVFAQAYEGRKNVILEDRSQCARSAVDRVLLIRVAWEEAAANDAEAALFVEVARTPAARALLHGLVTSRRSEAAAQSALAIVYAHQIPAAMAGELPGPLRSFAAFSCDRAFPSASVWP